MLLQSGGDGRLARSRETSEPERSTLLLAELVALGTGKTRVPCDVAEARLAEDGSKGSGVVDESFKKRNGKQRSPT
jgi:hypothetical protein